jgi:hypothetical protein
MQTVSINMWVSSTCTDAFYAQHRLQKHSDVEHHYAYFGLRMKLILIGIFGVLTPSALMVAWIFGRADNTRDNLDET